MVVGTCFPLDSLNFWGALEIAQGFRHEPPNRSCVCLSKVSVTDETVSTGKGHQSQGAEAGDSDGTRGFRTGAQLRVIGPEKSSTGLRFVVSHTLILAESRGHERETRTTRWSGIYFRPIRLEL